MIEQLIEAERALAHGLVDKAERLYRQVAELDPRSSIAVVGLARVALERGDDRTAYLEARRALAIDPESPAAQHLTMRLAEVMAGRGEALPEVPESSTSSAPEGTSAVHSEAASSAAASSASDSPPAPASPPAAQHPAPPAPAPAEPPAPSPAKPPAPTPAKPPAPRRRRSVVDRLLGRRR